MSYVANARMYSVDPGAASAWNELFEWLAQQSGVELRLINHGFPEQLSELWSRPDLGCAFMCGFPYVSAKNSLRAVAAPVPLGAPLPGRPVYATRLVVRADSSFRSLQETFGGRLGYTAEDSHSGYNALRHHLLLYRLQHGAFYREHRTARYAAARDQAILAVRSMSGALSYALDRCCATILRWQGRSGSSPPTPRRFVSGRKSRVFRRGGGRVIGRSSDRARGLRPIVPARLRADRHRGLRCDAAGTRKPAPQGMRGLGDGGLHVRQAVAPLPPGGNRRTRFIFAARRAARNTR